MGRELSQLTPSTQIFRKGASIVTKKNLPKPIVGTSQKRLRMSPLQKIMDALNFLPGKKGRRSKADKLIQKMAAQAFFTPIARNATQLGEAYTIKALLGDSMLLKDARGLFTPNAAQRMGLGSNLANITFNVITYGGGAEVKFAQVVKSPDPVEVEARVVD